MLRLRSVVLCLSVFLVICTVACTRQGNTFYFATADLNRDDDVLTYYRVRVEGCSVLNKTDLHTGFYDADAVRALYGEVKKENALKDLAMVQMSYNESTQRWEATPSDALFTIFYGNDATALAAQVRQFASGEKNGKLIGSLFASVAGSEKLSDAVDAETAAKKAKSDNEALAKELEGLKGRLAIGNDVEKSSSRKELLRITQMATRMQGASASFDPDPEKGFPQAKEVRRELEESN